MLEVREFYINKTKGYRFGESDWYESFTDSKAELFKSCQKDFGRCVSKMYIELKNGGDREIGWVFEKRMQYDDARSNQPEDYYIREVWIEVREVEEWQNN
jgi:hypothetical protein